MFEKKKSKAFLIFLIFLFSMFCTFFIKNNITITDSETDNLATIRVSLNSQPSVKSKVWFFQKSSQDLLDWGPQYVNAQLVWGNPDAGYLDLITEAIAGNNIRVAILDDKFRTTHEDVSERFDPIQAVITWSGQDITREQIGHGTKVSGVLAMSDNEKGYLGVAPKVTLIGHRVGDNTVPSGVDWESVKNAIQWCIDTRNDADPSNDIDIINISLGEGSGNNPSGLETKCAAAKDAGIVIICSAGNYGNNYGNVLYPARYPSTIAVGAIQQDYTRRSDSCYGDDLDFVAPGDQLWTIDPNSVIDDYTNLFGQTSGAAPIVSGVCALVIEAFTKQLYHKKPTVDELLCVLEHTANDLGLTGWDEEYGYGLVDAQTAVNAVLTDSDSDGICDILENEFYNTESNSADTDNDSFNDYEEIFILNTDPLDEYSNPACYSPNPCRNFKGLPDNIRKIYFCWNAPTNYWAGNSRWSAWKYILEIKLGTTWTTIYYGTNTYVYYQPPSATTSYSYRLYCYNQHTGVLSIYLSWYGKAKSSGGGGGPMSFFNFLLKLFNNTRSFSNSLFTILPILSFLSISFIYINKRRNYH